MLTCKRVFAMVCILLAAWFIPGCLFAGGEEERQRLFFIGQDLDSVRDYYGSDCCPQADGTTTYLDFYALSNPGAAFGGLGMDLEGRSTGVEANWGSGNASAWKSAAEFPGALAIGLWITENDNPGGLARIVAGNHDAEARRLAAFIKAVGVTVFLRIGYEFDGSWNRGYENTDQYKKAFRRIVGVLREEQVKNVEYVWQSAAFPLDIMIDGGYTDIRQWYPGDEYVDWMGVSMFAHLDEKPGIKTEFIPPTSRELVGKVLQLARERGKPVFIAEASPQGYDLKRGTNAHIAAAWDGPQGEGVVEVSPEEIWEAWYAPLFGWMDENRDVVYALAYINCNWDSQPMWGPPYDSGYWGDTRLQVSPLLAERFTAAIRRWRGLD